MTSPDPAVPAPAVPALRTGRLWAVLAVLLVFGAVGLAGVAYGVVELVTGALVVGAISSAVGATTAVAALLLSVGVLYRVDRSRGAVGRRIVLFE